jgi:hypothetical protein
MIRRYKVELSCLRCHNRKLGCDKKTPCSMCIQTGQSSECRYPSLHHQKRRPRRRTALELTDEMGKVEEGLMERFPNGSSQMDPPSSA